MSTSNADTSEAIIDIGKSTGLQTIFSLFLGLMVTAFVGVGVYTFMPPPNREYNSRLEEIDRLEQEKWRSQEGTELSEADRIEARKLADERRRIVEVEQKERESWGRTTSIILIAFATLAMGISLVKADQLPVITNGLLLGGLFTMVYGVGWIVATDESIARFVVITIALGITLGLGYVRFVRNRTSGTTPHPSSPSGEADRSELERRVRDIENRMQTVGRVFAERGDPGSSVDSPQRGPESARESG